MCSINLIYGINKTLSKEDLNIFKNLFSYNEIRGYDSIGLYYKIKEKEFLFKNKGCINDNIEKINKHLSKENINFMFFHNRAKTQGCFNKNFNNHPFKNKRFIWLHNGIITNDNELKKKYNLKYKEETDSAIIGYLLEKKIKDLKPKDSINDKLKELLQELKGSYTFILYDKLKGIIYLIRKDNPLFIGYIKNLNLLLFSSTKEGLYNSIQEENIYLDYIKETRFKYNIIIEEIKNNIVFEKEAFYKKVAEDRIKKIVPVDEDTLCYNIEKPKPKVPFGNLLRDDFIKVGEVLVDRHGENKGKVLADGTINLNGEFGSIHSLSAKILNKESNNGWDFWNVIRDGKLVSIDNLRYDYAKKFLDY